VNGIDIPNAQTNITIRNGTLNGWANSGVYNASVSSANMVFERLNVSSGGFGIYVVGAGVVRDCNCQNNLYDGIICIEGGIISGCTADYNTIGISAYSCAVSGCTANFNYGDGIDMFSGTVSGCAAQNNDATGIAVSPGTVSGCLVANNYYEGILVSDPGSEVIGNNCIGNNTANVSSSAGIYIDASNNRVEDNHVTASGYAGISVNSSYSGNLIIKNSVFGNGGNDYLTPGSQVVGPFITTTGTISSANPWANFSF
jgi:parallel beta-helix repeat protein